jgi:hypothetical protein
MKLREEQGRLVTHYRLPYRFISVPKKKVAKGKDDLPPQHIPGQQNASRPPQNPHPGPSIPPSSVAPGSEHHSRRYAPSKRTQAEYVRSYAQHDTNRRPETVSLERLAPSEGPVLGGLRILLSGINFPPPPETIYARFGSLVTQTVRKTIHLTLEPDTDPGFSAGITHIRSNATCHLHPIRDRSKSPCPYISTPKDLNSDRVIAGSNISLTRNACGSPAFPWCSSWLTMRPQLRFPPCLAGSRPDLESAPSPTTLKPLRR